MSMYLKKSTMQNQIRVKNSHVTLETILKTVDII